MTAEQWLEKQMTPLRSGFLTAYTGMTDVPGFESPSRRWCSRRRRVGHVEGRSQGRCSIRATIEFMVVHRPPGQNVDRCDLCHDTSDNPMAVKQLKDWAGLTDWAKNKDWNKPGLMTAHRPATHPKDVEEFGMLLSRLDAAGGTMPAAAPAAAGTQPQRRSGAGSPSPGSAVAAACPSKRCPRDWPSSRRCGAPMTLALIVCWSTPTAA